MKEKKKSFSISLKLTLYAGLLIAIILAITNSFSYFKSKNSTFELLRHNQMKVAEDVATAFNDYGNNRRKAVEVLAKEIQKVLNKGNDEEVFGLLESFKEAFHFDLIYLGFEDTGKVFLSNWKVLDSSSFDLKNATWYKDAKKATKPDAYGPYQSVNGGHVLTYAMPIYQGSKLIGVVGADYTLEQYSKDVLVYGKSANTYAAVYSPDGEIMFHEYLDRILTKNPLSINITNVINSNPDFYLNPEEKNSLFEASDDKGNSYEVLCNKTLNPKFRICAVTESKVYTSSIREILFTQALAGIIATVVALILIRILISRGLSPLTTIQSGLNSFFDFINHK
ncbi:cache domain-containing protein, partial [Campylobacter aviculae]